jgi:Domain of unknown function (DUF4399)
MVPRYARTPALASMLLGLVLLLAACNISPPPSIRIVSPADGATVKGPKVKVEVSVQNWTLMPAGSPAADATGHLHFFIDTPASAVPVGQAIPPTDANAAYIHAGKDPLTSRELELSPGKHTITVVMGNTGHVALDNPIPKSITITVE